MSKRLTVPILIGLIALALLLLSGCNMQNPEKDILGTWYCDLSAWEFFEDNTFTVTRYYTGYKLVVLSGTYEIQNNNTLVTNIQKLSVPFTIKNTSKERIIIAKEGDEADVELNRYIMKNKALLGKWKIESEEITLPQQAGKTQSDLELNGTLEFSDDCTAKYLPVDGSGSYQGKIYFQDESYIVVQLATTDGDNSILFNADIIKLSNEICELSITYKDIKVELSKVNP